MIMSAMPVVTALYGSLRPPRHRARSRVSAIRMRERVALGDGASKVLTVAVRTHANNAESVPLALVLLLLAELCGGASFWLHVAGGSLLVARIMHAVGMPRPAPNVFRFVGTAVTWIGIAAIACWVLWLRRGG